MESRFIEIKKRLKAELIRPFLSLKEVKAKEAILVFSEPRGGSTWILELLSTIPNTATLFEPLHSNYGLFLNDERYEWGTYPDPSIKNEIMQKEWADLLGGNLVNSYVVSRSEVIDYINCDKLVIKFIMGTPFLPWVSKNIDLKYKPIYLMRHPLAVAKSTLENLYKRGEKVLIDHKWVPEGKNFTLFEKNKDIFAKDRPVLHHLIGRWCLNNYFAIKESKNNEVIKVHYEDLLLHPNTVLSNIFKIWNMETPPALFEKVNIPSSSDFRKDFRSDKNDQLKKWFEGFSNAELEDMEEILKRFEIDVYSMFDILPTIPSNSLVLKNNPVKKV